MKQTNFGRNFKALRESRSLTQKQVAKLLDVTPTTISLWETQGIQPSGRKSIDSICNKLDVTESDLFGFNDGYYAKATGLAPTPLNARPMADAAPAHLPLLGRVHAGDAQEPDVLDHKIPVPFEVAQNHPNAYFLAVEGDCMSKVYPEGCFVLIDPDLPPQNGSIAVVSIDGADYVMRKMFRGASTLVLSPDSYTSYDDIIITQADERTVELVGTVVWFQPQEELA